MHGPKVSACVPRRKETLDLAASKVLQMVDEIKEKTDSSGGSVFEIFSYFGCCSTNSSQVAPADDEGITLTPAMHCLLVNKMVDDFTQLRLRPSISNGPSPHCGGWWMND